jgi:hypothetical protein
LRAEGFFCRFYVLYGGIGKDNKKKISAVIFFKFLLIKPRILIGIQHKMLDPDPDEMNTDLKHWSLSVHAV